MCELVIKSHGGCPWVQTTRPPSELPISTKLEYKHKYTKSNYTNVYLFFGTFILIFIALNWKSSFRNIW